MTTTPYPLYLERTLSRRLWGGSKLQAWLDLPDPGALDPWGESWQVYAANRISNGPLAGRTLQQAADLWGTAFLGTAATGREDREFPLLAKFIDAAQDLSLQVHPNDEQARPHGQAGKAEAWLILEAEAGAGIYWGFRETVTSEQVLSAIAAGTLQDLLNRVEVSPGDVIYNPPGTVHAIGAGILLFEIQQSSDITYRLYDWNRRDSQGELRELHVAEAMEVSSLDGGEHARVSGRELADGETELVATGHFVLSRLIPGQAGNLVTDERSVELLTAVNGNVSLQGSDGKLELPAGTSLVLPAVPESFQLSGPGQLLRCHLPS